MDEVSVILRVQQLEAGRGSTSTEMIERMGPQINVNNVLAFSDNSYYDPSNQTCVGPDGIPIPVQIIRA